MKVLVDTSRSLLKFAAIVALRQLLGKHDLHEGNSESPNSPPLPQSRLETAELEKHMSNMVLRASLRTSSLFYVFNCNCIAHVMRPVARQIWVHKNRPPFLFWALITSFGPWAAPCGGVEIK